MIVYIVNSKGFYLGINTKKTAIEQELIYVEIPVITSFIKPKWDNENWIEGASQEEIDSYNNEILIQKKKEANELLKETDWYIIRFQETGKLIPQEILDLREEIRNQF
jgi:hypothetical protein